MRIINEVAFELFIIFVFYLQFINQFQDCEFLISRFAQALQHYQPFFLTKGRQDSESLAQANVSLCSFSLQWWQAFKTNPKLKATNWELKPSCAKWNKWNGFPLGRTILLSMWCCLAALSAPISKGALPIEPSSPSFLSCSISLVLSSISFLYFQPRIYF